MKHFTTDRRVVVAGAGLVGALASLFFARRGLRVLLCEQRADPRKRSWQGGRSINLAISTRGLNALERVGLREKALEQCIRMPGREIHAVSGERVFQLYGTEAHHCIHSISRGSINEILLEALSKESKVEVQFETRVEKWSPEGWVFFGPSGSFTVPKEEYLIATDGGGSIARKQMIAYSQSQATEEFLDYGYKELTIPAGAGAEWQLKKEALHIWPRGKFMTIALPNLDGSFTVTLFLPYEGETSFARLTSSEAVTRFFSAYFPDVVSLIPDLLSQFEANPTGHMATVRSGPWHSQSMGALLLGDAAHAIVPFFGQGMNCGFEDVSYLDGILASGNKDWISISEQLFELRKPNADAIATMALENFIEMRDLVGDKYFLMQKEVEKRLEREFPGLYQSRYEMVSFSRIPYSVAWRAGEKQKQLLSKLCQGVESAENIDKALAHQLIEKDLREFFPYWEDKNGSWH
jgi:kynurenine 3-monooxygenase